jgi:uncharacterized protein (TIGR02246 family)
MSARKPEEWPSVFDQKLNAGDLEGMIALYEVGAAFVRDSSELVVDRDNVRHELADLVRKRPQFESKVEQCVMVDDIALLYTNFSVTMPGSEKPVETMFRAVEILRRQQDGSWKLIVGDPNGRKRF